MNTWAYPSVAVAAVLCAGMTISQWHLKRHHTGSRQQIIICGAGTGGCVTAYFLAKWMEENDVPGKVLLLDCGAPYYATKGPR